MRKILILLLTATLLICGCSQSEENMKSQETVEKIKLRFGVLPIEDTLPIFVADEEGIFDEKGLKVEIVNFQSALERDSALTAGEIDGVITDPLAVILLRNSGYDLKIVSIGLGMTPEEGVFAILASPESGIDEISDLEGRKIAISSNTIIEYVTDVILNEYGITAEKENVKSIPLRMQMLTESKIDAATLPEPLASLAVHNGAKLIIADSELNRSVTQTVIVFDNGFIKSNPEAVEKFLDAYGEAVKRINENPDKYRDIFIEKARIPAPLTESYRMPHYPEPQKYPEEFYSEVVDWAFEKGLISEKMPYEDAIYD